MSNLLEESTLAIFNLSDPTEFSHLIPRHDVNKIKNARENFLANFITYTPASPTDVPFNSPTYGLIFHNLFNPASGTDGKIELTSLISWFSNFPYSIYKISAISASVDSDLSCMLFHTGPFGVFCCAIH